MTVMALQLDPQDDAAILLASAGAGARVTVPSHDAIILAEAIPIHHKIALRDLPAGADLRRGGLVIGRTTKPIARGAHIHIHNLVSLRARPVAEAAS
ncbi:MAG: UxaA family hydrolase [Pseudomonadota bacterium]